MYQQVRRFQPRVVVVDPITNFLSAGTQEEVKAMLMRLIDFLKSSHVTALFTSLTHGFDLETTDVAVSSLIEEHTLKNYRVKLLGQMKSTVMRYFAISPERRISNLAVTTIIETAHREIFG